MATHCITTFTRCVLFDQGSPVSGSVVRRVRPATSLAWHPLVPTLVCGWETGEVTVHCLHMANERSAWSSAVRIDVCIAPPVHQNAITAATWSTDGGTRLLTGDAVCRHCVFL